jgi:RND family efflux transporter MFP subunit
MRVVVVAMFALIAACNHKDKATTTDKGAPAPAPAPLVKKKEAAEKAGYIGVLVPHESVEVAAPFTTKIDKILVKLGDAVKKGDTIARLDPKSIQQEINVAKAAYRTAGVAAGAASSKLKSLGDGLKSGVVSQVEYDAARFDAAKAGAAVEQEKARIQQLEAKLKDLTIVAPISGSVALRHFDDGARVSEGQSLVRIISAGQPFVKFAIPSKDSRKLAVGDAIEIKIENGAANVNGVVKQVAPAIDPIAQMTIAEADLVDPPADLQAGTTCHVLPKAKPPKT